MLASNLKVTFSELIVDRTVSGERILAVTVRAFHKNKARSHFSVRPLARSLTFRLGFTRQCHLDTSLSALAASYSEVCAFLVVYGCADRRQS